ncbi:MAG TPA: nitrilase-related carbon-nitrogen hydrolase [Xanthobacteraceae bacterium]|jgi:N-carbamoylputrescine amidase
MAVRVGLVQMDCSGARERNLARAEQMIREAAGREAQVVLLPEVFHELFFITDLNSRYFEAAEPIPGPITEAMQKLARELDIVIVAPIYECVERSVYYNSAAVIDADGKLLGVYRKNHIPLNTIFYEKLYFKPGNLGYPVFNTRYGKIGILICHDRHYPEGARALALNGAEIVLIPSATPDKSLSRKVWEKELCAHAIFNEYFVAGLNRTGQEGNYLYYGHSVAFDPAGEMLAQAGSGEEVLMVDCDLDLITQRRRAWQFYRDRRPDTYGILTALVP